MRISFKETNNGKTNEIYYNNQYIGDVDLNLWTGKWGLKPKFDLGHYVKESMTQLIKLEKNWCAIIKKKYSMF